jgi:possible type II DNA restriction endonuclease
MTIKNTFQGAIVLFIQLEQGSAGYSLYQGYDFIGMSGKTFCGYSERLNKYNGLFLTTILDLERNKFSYSRSWTGDRLLKTNILLPAIKINETDFEPDWDFMENYIKTLKFANII